MSPRGFIAQTLAAVFICLAAICLNGQILGSPSARGPNVEIGRFLLHNALQHTGDEEYRIQFQGNSLVLASDFTNADRGTAVPLRATLQTRRDLTPERFSIKGRTSATTAADISVDIESGVALVREGEALRRVPLQGPFFMIRGYAPVAVQMMLIRYWLAHGRPRSLRILPDGQVTVEARGRDLLQISGEKRMLDRYAITGVIWGRETVWLDTSNNLVALVTVDAQLVQFEAVREGYESLLRTFVLKAANDSMEELAHLAQQVHSVESGTFAIVGGKLIDGTARSALEDSVVVVEGGWISAVGQRGQIRIPPEAKVIDVHGRSVLPGLWDMHAHFNQVEWGPVYLAAGITTVRDCANEFDFEVAVRDAINSGHGLGPRLLLAGLIDGYNPAASGVMTAKSPEQARSLVSRYHAAGFVQIKIYNSVPPDLVSVITTEAHGLGMTVTGHIPKGMTGYEAVESGLDQINHVRFVYAMMLPPGSEISKNPFLLSIDAPIFATPIVDEKSADAQRAFRFLKTHGTVIDPTLALFELHLHSSVVPISSFEPGIQKVAPELLAPLNDTALPASKNEAAHSRLAQYIAVVRGLHRAGIPVVAGTDQTVPGHSLHRELELYVSAGFTPMEAIQAATIVPAQVMKLERELGTVEAGKRADLVVVDGDPLSSISDIRKTRFVIKDGRIYDCRQLWTLIGFRP